MRECLGSGAPLSLSEPVGDEGGERVHGRFRVRSIGAEHERRSALGGEHHDAHDALAIDLHAVLHEGDLALEAGGDLHDLGRRPGVEPVLVDDLHRSFDHQRATESRAKRAIRMSASLYASTRTCTRTSSTDSSAAPRSTTVSSDGPPSWTRAAASGSATPAAAAAARPTCAGPPRRSGLPSAGATASPCVQPTRSPQMRSAKWPAL